MKSIHFPHRTVIFFLILFIPLCVFTNPPEKPNVIVLTPQRCGTHWLLYSLRELTKASPVIGLQKNGTPHEVNSKYDLFGDPLNNNISYFLVHVHHPNSIKWTGSHKSKLIVIIRDYKESILRMFNEFEYIKASIGKKENDPIFNTLPPYYGVISWYFENLEYYEDFKGDKFLVYYEDLLVSPEKVYREILAFLDTSDEYLESFMNDLQLHKEICIRFYNKHRFGSKTEGKDFRYHSKQLSQEQLIEFDHLIEERYPELWDKYLHRYKEPF